MYHRYLLFSSFHPNHTKSSIPNRCSEFLMIIINWWSKQLKMLIEYTLEMPVIILPVKWFIHPPILSHHNHFLNMILKALLYNTFYFYLGLSSRGPWTNCPLCAPLEYCTCPLHMDPIGWPDCNSLRNEIVLYSWIDLHNVSTLSTDIYIVNNFVVHVSRTRFQYEGMGAVLERAAKLCCVDRQLQINCTFAVFDYRVVLDRRLVNYYVITER